MVEFFENGGKSKRGNYKEMREYNSQVFDHCCFYKTSTGKIIFASQPYFDDEDSIKETVHAVFGNEFDLKFYEKSESWYRPGETCLFVVRLKQDDTDNK